MELSVIVPVYNMAAEGKLAYCLDSLLQQTLRRQERPDGGEVLEIIAVDDASTDDSLEILLDYQKRYPECLRVIHYEQNKRQGGAKNEGLRVAQGQWIGFVDSDDWVALDCYEKLLAKAEATGADLVGCDYSLVTEHTMTPGKIIQNNTLDQTGPLTEDKHKALFMRPGSMVIKIYRHQVIRDHQLRFPEGIFYEDNCAGPLWSLYFTHFEKVEEPLYYYYQHDASTVHFITEAKCRDRMKAAELLYEESLQRGLDQQYGVELEYRFTELYYAITLFSYLSGVRSPKLGFVKELREGVESRFPRFQENPYYRQYTGGEEQTLIALQSRSDLRFFWYYRCKQWVRRLRKRKK